MTSENILSVSNKILAKMKTKNKGYIMNHPTDINGAVIFKINQWGNWEEPDYEVEEEHEGELILNRWDNVLLKSIIQSYREMYPMFDINYEIEGEYTIVVSINNY